MSITVATIAEGPEVRTKAAPLNESLLVASILVITATVYGAVLGFPFAYDDNGQIVQNPQILSWRYVPQYFRGQVWQYLFPDSPGDYYRPINLLWFRINDALFGLRPEGWHAATLALHLLATYLVYVLARKLTQRPLVAAATALLFGVHPTRHGVVAWVSGSTESLWTVLFLLAFLTYLRSREGHKAPWIALSCAFYALALFSKETAIMLPAVVFMHSLIYGPPPTAAAPHVPSGSAATAVPFSEALSGAVRVALAYMPVAVVYLFARRAALHGFSNSSNGLSAGGFLLTLPSVAWFYASQWLFPVHMSEFYALQLQHAINFRYVLAPILALVALAGFLQWCRKRLGSREVLFATAWMVLILLPAFDLVVFPANDLVHDRYSYCPSFGAALLVGLALGKLANGRLVFGMPEKWVLATLALLVLMAYGTANASSYWIDDYILFEHAYKSAPANGVVRSNYAVELGRRYEMTQALSMLRQLVQEEPNSWLANYNFARILYQTRQLPEAEKYYLQAVRIDPNAPDSFMQLGLLELQTNRPVQAEEHMRRAATLRPTEPNFHFGLGIVLAQRGDCVDARSEFATTLQLKPDLAAAKRESDQCKQTAGIAQTPPSVSAPVSSH